MITALVLASACGKRGNPIPPYSRIPSPPTRLTLKRLADDVYVSLTIPSTNVDNSVADLARVDLYAYTATQPIDAERLTRIVPIVASVPVLPRREEEEGEEPPATASAAAAAVGAAQGSDVRIVEPLKPSALVPIPAAETSQRKRAPREPEEWLGPAGVVGRAGSVPPQRYYVAVSVSRDGHKSAPSEPATLSLASYAPGAPTDPTGTFTAAAIVLEWGEPASGVRLPIQAPAVVTPRMAPLVIAPVLPWAPTMAPSVIAPVSPWAPTMTPSVVAPALPPAPTTASPVVGPALPPIPPKPPLSSRPLGDLTQPFGPQWDVVAYNVYETPAGPEAATPPWLTEIPAPLNAEPITATTYSDTRLVFAVQRCYTVRGLNRFGDEAWEGAPSAPVCVTPRDIFPPSAPRALAAVASPTAISLIWEPSPESDVAGYVVLRGAPGSATLQRLTPTPIPNARYRDEAVTPGTRYTYVVIAVDKSGNESDASNRIEAVVPQ